MILDVIALRSALARGESFSYQLFWGHRPRGDGELSNSCFSQWWRCSFTVAEQRYTSAEQFMMAEKARLFADAPTRERILATDDPAEAKRLGRGVAHFEEGAWAAVRFDLVTSGNVAKFGQDERLRAYLLDTRDAILVEASPNDAVWGIGHAAEDRAAIDPASWRGLNLLGFALVRARAILRDQLPGFSSNDQAVNARATSGGSTSRRAL